MKLYFHTAERMILSGRDSASARRKNVEVESIPHSPLSRASKALDPTAFLHGFYDWAKLNRAQVVELGPGEAPRLPSREGISSYAYDFKRALIESLPPHIVGIVGNISHLPQTVGPLTERSCDVVYWHSEMLAHLVEYEGLINRLKKTLSEIMRLSERERSFVLTSMSQAPISSDDTQRETVGYLDELRRSPGQFYARMQGTDIVASLRGIYGILKIGGYFVETDPQEDVNRLLGGFSAIGLSFCEAHFIVPEGQENIWAIAFKKA